MITHPTAGTGGSGLRLRSAERPPGPRPEPADSVAAFQRRSLAAYFATLGDDGREFLERTSAASRELRVWAETAESEIVGAMTLVVSPGSARIGEFTVRPDRLRTGIGRRLLGLAEELAVEACCRKLWVHSRDGLDSARFYLGCGFRREALLHNHWAGYARVIYSKDLGPPDAATS